ncbi:DNA polymerase III subunit gamma and tau [Xylanimonas protaetiae]|uniref:DNA-directed DNA polymerase n=1 Tax=Xylanimonas protaetiae TaxID=2509457 RepID=A0A4P6F2J9_9MICO|nr:DNA polymerase III subunit gamma and tau [Xylanimonas protaetiae]QAY69782.1 DNA polymerase III subunit gamma and tau [Xylanimonas protaetiae]
MTTALYRRYRPETFAEVIGQEHVTGPLMQALRSGRVNHAYLFSGPRGCGKTTSARILARTLNCHANTPQTPLDTPCGVCPSCVELARGGSGSLDVVEIDAASHGGVDDARDLRERATFAPARDRYKIFIIDEAHMVSSAGFNALLKIVEEPPPHIKFVFATTEPDKVIGTIRSRTHHYPFRLVPPDVLAPYLESLCASEGVTLGGGVVPLVVRAGGGSVRDSLSVLDQLIAGASGGVVDYDLAVGLLGYTHSSLLDDVVDALAARDGASLFRVVDQLIASGHAPQRFVDDLLERLRDLIVIAVSGDAAGAVLRGQPADQLERMGAQASRLGVAELSRAADLVNAALTEMTGATSPRLHLELLCARLLLPGADEGTAGLAARVERLERGGLAAAGRVGPPPGSATADDTHVSAPAAGEAAGGLTGVASVRAAIRRPTGPAAAAAPVVAPVEAAPTPGPATEAAPATGPAEPVDAAPASGRVEPVDAARASAPSSVEPGETASAPERAVESVTAAPVSVSEPVEIARTQASLRPSAAEDAVGESPDAALGDVPAGSPAGGPGPVDAVPTGSATAGFDDAASVRSAAPAPAGGITTEVVRRRWDEVLGSVASPGARAFLKEHAQVLAIEDGVLRLGFGSSLVAAARRGNTATISDAVYGTLGIAVAVDIVEIDAASGARPRDPAPQHPQEDPSDPDDPAQPADDHLARRADVVGPNPAGPDPAGPHAAGLNPAGISDLGSSPTRHDAAGPDAVGPDPAGSGAAGERSDVSRNGTAAVTGRSGSGLSSPVQVPAALDEADAAWLAGASMYEPPAEDEPEPPLDDLEPERPGDPGPARRVVGTVTAPAGTPLAAPPVVATRPGMPRRETPVEAVQRHALQARTHGAPSSDAGPSSVAGSPAPFAASAASPDPYDDAARDDPEIASTGLVGVPLVVTVLDGTVIDEQIDQA